MASVRPSGLPTTRGDAAQQWNCSTVWSTVSFSRTSTTSTKYGHRRDIRGYGAPSNRSMRLLRRSSAIRPGDGLSLRPTTAATRPPPAGSHARVRAVYEWVARSRAAPRRRSRASTTWAHASKPCWRLRDERGAARTPTALNWRAGPPRAVPQWWHAAQARDGRRAVGTAAADRHIPDRRCWQRSRSSASPRGSPFFAQERVGLDGRRFRMFKLRTMVNGAHLRHERACT